MLQTRIEKMIEIIKRKASEKKTCRFSDISKELKWSIESVEKILLILEKANLAKTHYSVIFFLSPSVKMGQTKDPQTAVVKLTEEGEKLDQYAIENRESHLKSSVQILKSKTEKRPVYRLEIEEISPFTRAYIDYQKSAIAEIIPIAGVLDKEEAARIFELRYNTIFKTLKNDLDDAEEVINSLSQIMLNEMYGLGKIEALIKDEKLEEIVINSSKNPVAVYHRKYGWLKTNVFLESEKETQNYSEAIARKVGRQISVLNPILDAHLGTGDRVNATLTPISSAGNTITLRLFARNPWTMVSYLKKQNNSMSYEMAALLWQAIQFEMNIIIAGGTASGKTSALNGLLALVQPFQRIVTIEDTRELMLPSFQWNWVPLVTRQPNPEGAGEVTMLDLVVNSLRMRPDRIVMGEIRRKKEAEVLFEAIHTGQSVYATIHADTGSQVIKRLIEPPIEVPPAEVEDVHLVVIQYRDRRKNVRRTLEISEILPGDGKPELNRLYNWKSRTDTFEAVKAPRRYVEQINLHTGYTEKEIAQDQQDKTNILKWMVKNELDKVEEVGKVMRVYYSEPDFISEAAKKDKAPKDVFE